jgi:glyoxylase-like metal-dependent hydrolase (beta-lactamase superfamily II)
MRPLVIRGRADDDRGRGSWAKGRRQVLRTSTASIRARSLDHTLAEAGLAPEDIGHRLASHLHFDHAADSRMRGPDGRLRPRFPPQQYVVRRGEWDDATHPHARNSRQLLVG